MEKQNHSEGSFIKCFALIAVLLPAICVPWRSAAPNDSLRAGKVREALNTRIESLRRQDGFPGATAAVVLSDGTLVAGSTGMSDLEARTPMKPSDRMLAGSIGKTFFAAVAMNLIHEGKLDLGSKIEKWIGTEPWFNRIPNAHQITLRMLMNHTSGIPEHVESPDFVAALQRDPDKSWTAEELLAFTFGKLPMFPAGTDWSYADTNFILMSFIAEKVTGKRCYDLIQKQILDPLRLSDTIPSTSRVLPGLITGYSMHDGPFGFEGRTIYQGKFVLNPQFEWAGGGFLSTSSDLARWAKVLYEAKAFPASMLAVMLQSVPAKTGPGDRYGLGVQIRQTEFGETYGHGGWFPGYLSEMEYFPEQHVAIAVQINTDGVAHPAGKTHSYIVAIAKDIFDCKQKSAVTLGPQTPAQVLTGLTSVARAAKEFSPTMLSQKF
jgi:D-alanyl-D-alanine carboxypeptidase